MNLFLVIQALLGILVKDAPIKSIEHVDSTHMILTTEDARVTITVEKIHPGTLYIRGDGQWTNTLPNLFIPRATNGWPMTIVPGFYKNTTEIKP